MKWCDQCLLHKPDFQVEWIFLFSVESKNPEAFKKLGCVAHTGTRQIDNDALVVERTCCFLKEIKSFPLWKRSHNRCFDDNSISYVALRVSLYYWYTNFENHNIQGPIIHLFDGRYLRLHN